MLPVASSASSTLRPSQSRQANVGAAPPSPSPVVSPMPPVPSPSPAVPPMPPGPSASPSPSGLQAARPRHAERARMRKRNFLLCIMRILSVGEVSASPAGTRQGHLSSCQSHEQPWSVKKPNNSLFFGLTRTHNSQEPQATAGYSNWNFRHNDRRSRSIG